MCYNRSPKIKYYVFHHNSITNQQVRMLTLSQNRQQQLFCIKKTKKFQLIFTFLVMKFHFFDFLEEPIRIKKKYYQVLLSTR
jgi:hypothetical protein